MSTARAVTIIPFLSRYYKYIICIDLILSSSSLLYSSSELGRILYDAPASRISQIFNDINWTPEEIQRLESSVLNSTQYAFCAGPVSIHFTYSYGLYMLGFAF